MAVHTCDKLEAARSIADRAKTGVLEAMPEKIHTDTLLSEAKSAGLFSVVVPPAFGGPGLGIADTARITFELARGSGSLGLTYAMHMSQALTVVRHGADTSFFHDFQARMVTEQILIASVTSEKGVGGDIFRSICSVEPTQNAKFEISKQTPNISYMDHAGAALITAMQTRPGGRPRQALALAEMNDISFEPGPEAGFFGMRGILNRSYALKAHFPEAAIFPANFSAIASRTMTPTIHILWAALWSGLAAATLAKAKAFVAAQVAAEGPTGQAVRHDLSDLIDRHYMLNAMIRDAIAEEASGAALDSLDFGFAARLNRLKVAGSTLLVDIVTGCLRIIGLQGYALVGPYSLAAELRDAFSAPVMVSNYRLTANNARIESFVEERV